MLIDSSCLDMWDPSIAMNLTGSVWNHELKSKPLLKCSSSRSFRISLDLPSFLRFSILSLIDLLVMKELSNDNPDPALLSLDEELDEMSSLLNFGMLFSEINTVPSESFNLLSSTSDGTKLYSSYLECVIERRLTKFRIASEQS